MPVVTLRNVHKSFGPEVIFDDLSLSFYPKEKVGMVGDNGSGKTTILRMILRQTAPDAGAVVARKGLRIGYLPQESTFDPESTIMEQMYAGVEELLAIQDSLHSVSGQLAQLSGAKLESQMKEYDRLTHLFEMRGGYEYETRIKVTLTGLGFDEGLFEQKLSTLSGGQLSRLGLAKVLMLEADLLMLDEPTNHLDLQSTEWLEKFLKNYNGAAIIISHDRYLLDRVACKIVEIRGRGAKTWKGNYSNYLATRQTVVLQEKRQQAARVEMVRRTRDFIARNKNKEGMRKTARGRATRLDKLLKDSPDFLDGPMSDKKIRFSFGEIKNRSDLILRCEGLGKSFGDLKLFENLTFDILAGGRFGITGPNGTGKSTFLRLAIGALEPTAGTIRMGESLSVGYLDQHGAVLDPDKTVMEEAQSADPQLARQQLRNTLAAFLFRDDDVLKKVGSISGGQQNRLMLCKLVLSRPDVMILDEPTNHLDIASRETLEQALDSYDGTIIVVSHDRFFLDRVAEELLVIGVDEYGRRAQGKNELITRKQGKNAYSQYVELVRQRAQDLQRSSRDSRRTGPKQKRQTQNMADAGAAGRKTPTELREFNKYTVEQLEEMVIALESEIDTLQEGFGYEKIYHDRQRLAEHHEKFDAKTAELELLYRAYELRTG